jgi:hypothetical protein
VIRARFHARERRERSPSRSVAVPAAPYPSFSASPASVPVAPRRFDWVTAATPDEAPADVWQSAAVNLSARYVRFYFGHPRRLPVLGYLCDVQILARVMPRAANA